VLALQLAVLAVMILTGNRVDTRIGQLQCCDSTPNLLTESIDAQRFKQNPDRRLVDISASAMWIINSQNDL